MGYTASDLQREFRLPPPTAESIIREQMALARRHYRGWTISAVIVLITGLVGSFVLSNPWSHTGFRVLAPAALLITSTTELLAQRRAEAPIRAAARAAQANITPVG